MRNMSFALTTDQIRNRTKTVTRRTGWDFLKPGDHIRAVVKGMGLRKGEKVQPLAVLRVESIEGEWMSDFESSYGQDECDREGFPHLTPRAFNAFFRSAHKDPGLDDLRVNRIEFSYVDDVQAASALTSTTD